MSEEFGAPYAQAYDSLYQDKDYAAECDLIERIIRVNLGTSPTSILDLGCGTGGHAIELARRGHEVVGIDRSTWMIAAAQRKIAGNPSLRITVSEGDIRRIELHRDFSVVLMMFAVLGYQLEDDDVLAAFGTARRHLMTGGLLIFDVWFGPAVLQQRPSARTKSIVGPGGTILRSAESTLDARHHRCTVRFHLQQLEGGRVVSDADERHQMRYFFRDELDRFLTAARFALLRLGAFPDFDAEPDDTTWNVLAVARAV